MDYALQDRHKQLMLLTVVAMSLFLDGLDGTIVNVVLPEIAMSFGTDTGGTSWVVTVYFLMMAGLILIFGKIADGGAIKRVFTWGLLVFSFSSLACGLSESLGMLLVFRAAQGIGAAMLAVSAFMLCVKYLPKRMAAFALSVSVLGTSIGAAMGPVLGGVLAGMASWHWVFFINVPVGLVAVALAHYAIPADGGFTGKGFDLKGAVLLFISLVSGLYVLESSPGNGFDELSLVCVAVFVVCFSLFVRNELRVADPLLKLSLFRYRRLIAAIVVMVIMNMCYMGCLYLLPFYLDIGMGLDSVQSGMYLLIPAASTLVFCLWVGKLADRIGNRPFVIVACIVMLAAMVLFSLIDSVEGRWILVSGLVCMGVMWGIGGGPVGSRMLENLPDEDRPSGSSILSFIIYFGCAAGTALFAGLFGLGSGSTGQSISDLSADVFIEGFCFSMVVGAVLSLIALVLSWAVNERRPLDG